jgi:hypothetical protein
MWFDFLFFKSLHEEKIIYVGREGGDRNCKKIEEKQEGGGGKFEFFPLRKFSVP